jgi:hypothetical protein
LQRRCLQGKRKKKSSRSNPQHQPRRVAILSVSWRLAQKIYDAYPRKTKSVYAKECIIKHLKNGMDPDKLLAHVEEWARMFKRRDTPKDKIPHCSTFMNQEYWLDDIKEYFPPEKKYTTTTL